MGINFLGVSENYSCKDKWICGQWSCQYNVIGIATRISNSLDQLNIEIHEKRHSTNVVETTVIDFISIQFFLFKIVLFIKLFNYFILVESLLSGSDKIRSVRECNPLSMININALLEKITEIQMLIISILFIQSFTKLYLVGLVDLLFAFIIPYWN